MNSHLIIIWDNTHLAFSVLNECGSTYRGFQGGEGTSVETSQKTTTPAPGSDLTVPPRQAVGLTPLQLQAG